MFVFQLFYCYKSILRYECKLACIRSAISTIIADKILILQ